MEREDPDAELPDDELQPVLWAHTVPEAREVTELLRSLKIPAVAVVPSDQPLQPGDKVPVAVPAQYVDVATQLLDLSTHRPEGDVSNDEIERELIEAAARRGEPEHDPVATILRPSPPRDPRRLVLGVFVIAIIGWMLFRALRLVMR